MPAPTSCDRSNSLRPRRARAKLRQLQMNPRCAEWSSMIAPTVPAVHAYRLPYREASTTTLPPRRSKPIAGPQSGALRSSDPPCILRESRRPSPRSTSSRFWFRCCLNPARTPVVLRAIARGNVCKIIAGALQERPGRLDQYSFPRPASSRPALDRDSREPPPEPNFRKPGYRAKALSANYFYKCDRTR